MNWYKIAKKEQKPYKIFLRTPGEVREIGKTDAVSKEQAVKRFLTNNSKYRDYLNIGTGCFIDAVFNEEEFNRVKEVKQLEKEKKEEQIQDAWWNK